MQYDKQINLRITEKQLEYCLNRGGITNCIRTLLDERIKRKKPVGESLEDIMRRLRGEG